MTTTATRPLQTAKWLPYLELLTRVPLLCTPHCPPAWCVAHMWEPTPSILVQAPVLALFMTNVAPQMAASALSMPPSACSPAPSSVAPTLAQLEGFGAAAVVVPAAAISMPVGDADAANVMLTTALRKRSLVEEEDDVDAQTSKRQRQRQRQSAGEEAGQTKIKGVYAHKGKWRAKPYS